MSEGKGTGDKYLAKCCHTLGIYSLLFLLLTEINSRIILNNYAANKIGSIYVGPESVKGKNLFFHLCIPLVVDAKSAG